MHINICSGEQILHIKLAAAVHCWHTGCPRRNVPDFGRMFIMLKYTDITQNTYIQSWTVTEIMARETCGLLAVPRTVPVQLTRYLYTAHVRPWSGMSQRCCCVTNGCTELQKCLLCFPTWNTVTCILCMDFARSYTSWLLPLGPHEDVGVRN